MRYSELVARAERHDWVILNVYGWGATMYLRDGPARIIEIHLDGSLRLLD
jgi:hypothetical protein